MEEIMNNEIINEELENDEPIVVCETESESSIGGKILAGILVATGIGIVALVRKARRNKEADHESKLDAWRIKRLEKKGYIVHKREPIEIIDDTVECDDE